MNHDGVPPASAAENKGVLDSLKALAANAQWVLLGLVLSKLLTYLYKFVIARSGADFFGKFSLGYAVFDIAAMLAGLGLAVGVSRFVPEYAARRDEKSLGSLLSFSFKAGAAAGLVAAAGLFVSADWIAVSFFQGSAGVAGVMRLLSFAIPFFVLQNILVAAMQGFKKMVFVAISKNVAENALKLASAGFAVFGGASLLGVEPLYALAAGFVAALFLVFLLSLGLVQRLFPLGKWRLGNAAKPAVGSELLAFSLPYLVVLLLNSVVTWADTLLLGHFRTAAETGVYTAALTTALFMLIAPGVVASVITQVLVELQVGGKRNEMKRVYSRVLGWIFLLNFPVFLYFALFSRQVLGVLYGSEYAAGGLAFVALSFAYLVYSVNQQAESALAVLKKPRLILLNSAVAAVASVALNWLLVPAWGVAGAGIATASALIVFSLLCQHQVSGLAGLKPSFGSFVKPLAAGLLAIAATYGAAKLFFGAMPLWLLVAVSLAYGVAYLLLLFALRGFDATDVELLKIAEKKAGLSFLAPLRGLAKKYYYHK